MPDPTTPWCPLGDEHCSLLTSLIQSCYETGQACDKLEAAGYDVSQWRAQNDHQMALAAGLKKQFFPERP
jgi:hypothetical protein